MYIVARTRSGRPSLMHRLNSNDLDKTVCGIMVWEWLPAYVSKPLLPILCKRCAVAFEKEGY